MGFNSGFKGLNKKLSPDWCVQPCEVRQSWRSVQRLRSRRPETIGMARRGLWRSWNVWRDIALHTATQLPVPSPSPSLHESLTLRLGAVVVYFHNVSASYSFHCPQKVVPSCRTKTKCFSQHNYFVSAGRKHFQVFFYFFSPPPPPSRTRCAERKETLVCRT